MLRPRRALPADGPALDRPGAGHVRWPASSFMIDDADWAIRGAILAVVGGALMIWFGRRIALIGRFRRQSMRMRHDDRSRCLRGACRRRLAAGDGEVGRAISYETGPCFGACPVYRVTVNARRHRPVRGPPLHRGDRRSAASGSRRRSIRAFAAPARAAPPGERRTSAMPADACEPMATDLPSAEVTWRARRGDAEPLFLLWLRHGAEPRDRRAARRRARACCRSGIHRSGGPRADYIRPSWRPASAR